MTSDDHDSEAVSKEELDEMTASAVSELVGAALAPSSGRHNRLIAAIQESREQPEEVPKRWKKAGEAWQRWDRNPR